MKCQTRNRSNYFLALTMLFIGLAVGYFLDSSTSTTSPNPDANRPKIPSDVMPRVNNPITTRKLSEPSDSPSGSANKSAMAEPTDQQEMQNTRENLYREGLSNMVNRTTAKYVHDYMALFRDLGLDDVKSEEFRGRLTGLHHAAVSAGEPMQALLKERLKFDDDIKKALGEDNYVKYRYYEESKPAIREFERISAFIAKEKNDFISTEEAQAIIHAIKQAGATTTETWHGPYDPLPRPAIGVEMVLDRNREKLASLSAGVDRLFAGTLSENVSPKHLISLKEYYSQSMNKLSERIAHYSRPKEEIMADLSRRLNTESRNAPKEAGFPPQ